LHTNQLLFKLPFSLDEQTHIKQVTSVECGGGEEGRERRKKVSEKKEKESKHEKRGTETETD